MLYINKYCKITKKGVFDNGKLVMNNNDGNNTSAYFKSIYKNLGIKYMKYFKMDMLSKLGFLASEILLNKTNLHETYTPPEIAVIISNSESSIDIDRKFYNTVTNENDIPAPAQFVYTLPNILIGEICIRHQLKGETAFLISKKFDANQIINYAGNMFQYNTTIQALICGQIEYSNENKFSADLFLVEKIDKTKNSINFDNYNLLNLYKS
jgi:hypothetical protein